MRHVLDRRLTGAVLWATLALGATACEKLLVDPGPEPGMIALALLPSTPNFAVAPASANRVRIQVQDDGQLLLDTLFSFDPEQAELLVPVRFAGSATSASILVEIGEDGLPLLWGSTEVLLRQRRMTDAEVRLSGAEVVPLAPVRELASGVYHSCAAGTGAGVFCWGNNDEGQLGNGKYTPASMPVGIEGSGGVYSLSAGFLTTCGLGFEGRAFCWGDNEFGSLGSGSSMARSAAPVPVDTEVGFSSVTVGGLHACGLGFEGTAYCWGFNRFGQLGDGTTTNRSMPTPAAGGVAFRVLSAGYLHTCGITTTGETLCWGLNEFGQLGDGTTEDRLSPTPIGDQRRFTDITAGGLHTCALGAQGEASCWGFNDYGQLGNGTVESAALPLRVGDRQFAAISAGGLHSCGITPGGDAYCWGYNRSGALGDDTREDRSSPVAVTGSYTFDLIRSGLHHTCGRVERGRVVCWGYNRFGQLGDGSRFSRPRPREVLYGNPFFTELQGGQNEMRAAVAALIDGRLLP